MPSAHEFVDSIHFVDAPDTSPVSSTGRTAQFVVPFDYEVPAGSGLARSKDDPHAQFAAWVDGEESPAPSQLYAGQSVDSGVERGIVVAAGPEPWAHGSVGRFYLGTDPADVLADLRDTAGIDLDPVTPMQLDGRPAQAAFIRDHAASDIHVKGPITGLTSGPFVILNQPCRLIVSQVNGQVVFVVVWAQTAEGLEAFLPTAMGFVDSIHFVDTP